jgi:hypothetical protein
MGVAEMTRTAGGSPDDNSDVDGGSAVLDEPRDANAAVDEAADESPRDAAVPGDAGARVQEPGVQVAEVNEGPASEPSELPWDLIVVQGHRVVGGEVLDHDNGLGFAFTDVTQAAGLAAPQWDIPESFQTYPCQHALYVTGGAAAVDINDDGWTDLFVTRLEKPNLLYLNNRDGTFRDVAPLLRLDVTRWSNAPAFADIDGDSDLDLFVTTAGPARAMLFVNLGNGKFIEEAALRGVNIGRTDGCSELTSATFGDYDHDGDLDLFVGHWASGEGNYNFLFKNDGTGHFSNVTQAAGLGTLAPRGYSSGFMDADGDGWEDLFIVADFWNSQLFHNNGNGTFSNVTRHAGVGVEEDGMGSAIGDVNGDGHPDWFVSNSYETGITVGNRLYINRGDGTFDDRSESYGITRGGWGWGALLFDVNNDGQLDASNVSGWIDQDESPTLWLGGALPWPTAAVAARIQRPINGRAYVPLDFDRDGDLDVFMVQNGAAPILYRNDVTAAKHWLVIQARGRISNTHGIGARVEVQHPNGTKQYRWITANTSFLGHGPFEAHIGLGEEGGPFTVRVTWPASGRTVTHGRVPPDQVITFEEP